MKVCKNVEVIKEGEADGAFTPNTQHTPRLEPARASAPEEKRAVSSLPPPLPIPLRSLFGHPGGTRSCTCFRGIDVRADARSTNPRPCCTDVASGTDFAEAFYVMYSVPVVSNRDVALYSNQLKGTYREPQNFDKRQITSRSIKHPKMGPTKKNVRGQCEVSRTVFTKVIRETKSGKKVETVELETMMHMNPKGSIPASVINMAVASATDSVAQMCTYMQQEWKVKAAAERTKPKQVAL